LKQQALSKIADSSLLMLADILPTGLFACVQAINHPKVAPLITGKPWPLCFSQNVTTTNEVNPIESDRILTVAIIGLGPVGVCATVGMLDMLATRNIPFRMVAIDPNEARREKIKAVYGAIGPDGKGTGEFAALSIDEAKTKVHEWTNGVGATAVLEVGLIAMPLCNGGLDPVSGRWKCQRSGIVLPACPNIWCHFVSRNPWRVVAPYGRAPVI
jgi:hypothetical protein